MSRLLNGFRLLVNVGYVVHMAHTYAVPLVGQGAASQRVAAEVRAEMARQNMTQTDLAKRLGKPQPWLSRRIGSGATTDLTIEEVVEMAEALSVSAQGFLSVLLPRLDSNQQPSGYTHPLVNGYECPQCDERHWPDEPCPGSNNEGPGAVVLPFRARAA